MGIAEIKKLPLNEKLQIMEALWDDLKHNAESLPATEWQMKLLDERQEAVERGEEKILEWDEIKDSL
jgi:putative addiction module component (TIGR02574 family)